MLLVRTGTFAQKKGISIPQLWIAGESPPSEMASDVQVVPSVTVAGQSPAGEMASNVSVVSTVEVAGESPAGEMASNISVVPTVEIAGESPASEMASDVQPVTTLSVAGESPVGEMTSSIGDEGGPWTPDVINTILWLDASDSSTLFDAVTGGSLVTAGNPVARIEDKSGNDLHFSQTESNRRPTREINSQNGLDVLKFNGSSQFLQQAEAILNTAVSVGSIFVITQNVSGSNRSIISNRSGSNGWTIRFNTSTQLTYFHTTHSPNLTLAVPNQANIYQINRNGLAIERGVNGVLQSSSTLSGYVPTSTTTFLGSELGTSSLFNSGICEVVIAENSSSQDEVVGYLAHKWGLTAGLPTGHPYKDDPPTL